jgi:hypothetical protein
LQAAQLRYDKSGVITALDQVAAGSAVFGMAAKPKAQAQASRGLSPARAGLLKLLDRKA